MENKQTNKQEKEYINKVNARDVFDDDNEGFIYGVEWGIGQNAYDVMWFKTEQEQEDLIKELKGGISE